ncbi:hypothetical protein HZB97_01485 [Candidatus Gottesmanbacteria bacterium]|nr:hypothetical protein [Candidatus Gottesmanbacteria bacterium]MBI5465455.1 hypothetical protein [Candidatus Gottesmanbacteria bacterium]
MPKKTKKEKIIAELRRKLETVKIESGQLEVKAEKKEFATPATRPTTHNLPPQPTSYSKKSSAYIIHDLRKTFILAGLAISLEVMIYWITELGGNRLLKFLPIFR